jgi:hypothetical protein
MISQPTPYILRPRETTKPIYAAAKIEKRKLIHDRSMADSCEKAISQSADPITSLVKIHLRPAGGNVAHLAQVRFKIESSKTILFVQKYIGKKLGMDASKTKTLWLFCGTGFSPAPDQSVGDLYRDFPTGDELHILYGVQETWG